MPKPATRKGQLLVEVLIGVGLLVVLATALAPLIISTSNVTKKQNDTFTANLLAKEQLEQVRAIKEEDWNQIYFPQDGLGGEHHYHIQLAENKWAIFSGEETVNGFTRFFTIEKVSRTGLNGSGSFENVYTSQKDDPSTLKVSSVVLGGNISTVVLEEYLTRWANSVKGQTDWSGGDGQEVFLDPPANQFLAGTNIDAATSGSLKLAKVPGQSQGTFGNQFVTSSVGVISNLSSSNLRSAMSFKALKGGMVNQLRIYIQTARNSGQINYRYGIQEDLGGNPRGSFLTYQDVAFSTTGWKEINLTTPVSLNSGQTYHIVVQHASGQAPSGTRYISIRETAPLNQILPLGQDPNSDLNTLLFNGVAWQVKGNQPLYSIRYGDGSFEGNPYDSFEERRIYGQIAEGEIFTAKENLQISAFNLYIAKTANQDPARNLRVVLQDLTSGNTLIDDSSISGNQLSTTFAWKAVTLASPQSLTAGNIYRFYLSSVGTSSSRSYKIYNNSNPGDDNYNQINFDGTNSRVTRSINNGGSWNDNFNFIDWSGFYFTTVSEDSYPENGDLTSSAFDFGKKVNFNRLSWNSLNLPQGTAIKFQLAASNNSNGPWTSFSGPDGSSGSFYEISSGENISAALFNNQYLRYKVVLETANNTQTPVLESVTINYSP